MPVKYTSLILDMDGTILDSLEAVENALRKAGEKWNIEITQELVDTALYSSNDELGRILNTGNKVDKFLGDVAAFYTNTGYPIKLFSGMKELLDLDIPLGIVTNENRKEIMHNLERLGIDKSVFSGICCAGDTPHIKPHPYPLQNCIEQMGVSKESAIYVGDSVTDMRCANAAGVAFGLALWGARDVSQFGGADYIFEKPEDVRSVLRAVLS